MTVRLRSWRKKIKQHRVAVAAIILVVVILLIVAGYWYDWTGFKSKTLWDWLNLLGVLAIPAVVGLGAAWYTAQQGKVSDRENSDNQRETALQVYIDKMSELLLHERLRDSAEKDEVRKIARVRTLTILLNLDANRKRSVLQFLYEPGLIDNDKCIVDLRGADLSGADLQGADLRDAKLIQAKLIQANLVQAKLSGADLSGAYLDGANLSYADLGGANLSGAWLFRADLLGADLGATDLRKADLSLANLGSAHLSGANLGAARLGGANLYGAHMDGANLSAANLGGANLGGANLKDATGITVEELEKQAKSLQAATMPDGSKHS